MLTYKYKLYKNRRTSILDAMLREACFVWNHALALQKRYYSLYKKYIPLGKMQTHFSKRIKRTLLYSQTTQEILARLDNGYQRFFKHVSKRPPKFKKAHYFSSFAYTQKGFKLSGNTLTLFQIKKQFKFSYSRPLKGKVKQIRIKRSRLGEYYLFVFLDADSETIGKSHNGASVGIDFGLKTFLTLSDGTKIKNPLFLKSSLNELRHKCKAVSRCKKGSNNRRKRREELARLYERVTNTREDWQWKLCHNLCRSYDFIYIEDLNMNGMAKHWGFKVDDIAYGLFVRKLKQVALKYGVKVVKINRYYPSSKTCSVCQYVNELLSLNDRQWVCPNCGTVHDRDLNAAVNILRQGTVLSGSSHKTQDSVQGALSTGESTYL